MKHLLAFFAFILVTLASVYADEGYIPFFLEPDGIGFRGPAEIGIIIVGHQTQPQKALLHDSVVDCLITPANEI